MVQQKWVMRETHLSSFPAPFSFFFTKPHARGRSRLTPFAFLSFFLSLKTSLGDENVYFVKGTEVLAVLELEWLNSLESQVVRSFFPFLQENKKEKKKKENFFKIWFCAFSLSILSFHLSTHCNTQTAADASTVQNQRFIRSIVPPERERERDRRKRERERERKREKEREREYKSNVRCNSFLF